MNDTNSFTIGRRAKIILSLGLIFHVMAVALPPLEFQAISEFGRSTIVEWTIRPVRGYGQFLHLNRGYAFFAPDPGPSHLIQAKLIEEGGDFEEIKYPDIEKQWPRLLYHRHFMVSEFLHASYVPPEPPPQYVEEFPEDAAIWRQTRGRYEHIRQSIIDHLKSAHPGKTVEIARLEHDIPAREDFVAEPIALNDIRLYRTLLDQPVFEEVLPDPTGPAEVIPTPPVDTAPPVGGSENAAVVGTSAEGRGVADETNATGGTDDKQETNSDSESIGDSELTDDSVPTGESS